MGRSPAAGRPNKISARRRVVPLEQIPATRMRWVFALLCVGLVGLMGRMAWLQMFQASELEARARSVQTQRTQPLGTRRPIIDRTGRLIALDEERYRLWLHPRYFNLPGDDPALIRPSADVAERLAPLLSLSSAEILKRIGNRPSGIKLLEGLDPETAAAVRGAG
ncbi:MAG: penicillin-binding protein 2, partial [Synechococcus sp. BS307-5m-G37]|nr:penicillin-binding protein 2 [Synechococcus sp. BS307-5m-G37]